jgi:4-amino-4-deoxy-L-arabinose transferase-like glycosyltransferase
MPVGSVVVAEKRAGWFWAGGVAVAVVAYMGLVWLALGELGMTWDEPYFFERTHDIKSWLGDLLGGAGDRARALSRDGLEQSWRFARTVPNQHPPLPELLSLVTGELFRWLLGPLRSYRLSTVLVFAAAAAILARLVGSRWGPWAAGAALGALLFNPRVFADAQQITADSDTGSFWFLAAVAFLRSCETGRRYWLFGMFAGLAVMCKATGVLVVPAMVLWALIHRPPGWRRPLAWAIPAIPAVMVAVMPPWWSNPAAGIGRWAYAFATYSQKVPVYYLGQVYDSIRTFLPWHNTIVLTATMVPLGLLGLAAAGLLAAVRPSAGRRLRNDADGPAGPSSPVTLSDRTVVSWAMINFMTWIVLRMFPGLPAHDGLRQLVPSFFFLPVLVGYGAHWLADPSGSLRAWAGRLVVIGCVASSAWSTLSFHPYELAYYNELIGGPVGAKSAGMETTYFWDTASAEVLNWMNDNLPPDSTVLIFPPPNVHTFQWEQRWGRLRGDLTFLNLDGEYSAERLALMDGPGPCYVIFQMRQGLYIPKGPGDPKRYVRLANGPALFELAPPRIGVRLLAIFDQVQYRRSAEGVRPTRRN